MRKEKTLRTIIRLVMLILLATISGQYKDTIIIFGSFYLLHSQAGGLGFRNHFTCILEMAGLWTVAILLGKYTCPGWLMFLLLILENATIFLFAPASGRAEPDTDIERRRKQKNRAFFTSGGLSFLVIATKGIPMSTQVLISLMAVAIDIWMVLIVSLAGSSSDDSDTEE